MNRREMNRRELLRGLVTLTAGGVVAPLAGINPAFALPDECPRIELERTVVNVMLQGGADPPCAIWLYINTCSQWFNSVLSLALIESRLIKTCVLK